MRQKQELKSREQEIEAYYAELKKRGIYTEDRLARERKKSLNSLHEPMAHQDAMGKTLATILLILGMCGSLIFKQWYYVWAILLLWYFGQDRV